MTYNIDDGTAILTGNKSKKSSKNKPNALIPNGGVITDSKMIKYLDSGKWEDEGSEDSDFESDDDDVE